MSKQGPVWNSKDHITNSSFSLEFVKLTVEAYVSIFESYLPDTSKEIILKSLNNQGAQSGDIFFGVLVAILRKLGIKVADQSV